MGSTRWSSDDWTDYSSTAKTKTRDEIFTSRSLKSHLDPKTIKVRESRDSDLNPNSKAIILAFDVTGSMGHIPEYFVKEGLGKAMTDIFNRKSVVDPHVMAMAIGDVEYDEAPLQVGQFEADLRIAQQLSDFWLESGGGGNNYESYILAWYFAAMKTSIDCFEKRKKKGYLFTIGDEELTPVLSKANIERFVGDKPQSDLTAGELFKMVSTYYHIFHIVVEQGSHASAELDSVLKSWRTVLGQQVLRLSDYTKLSEVIISAIEVNEGRDKKEVIGTWDKSTAVIVGNAISGIEKARVTSDVVMF